MQITIDTSALGLNKGTAVAALAAVGAINVASAAGLGVWHGGRWLYKKVTAPKTDADGVTDVKAKVVKATAEATAETAAAVSEAAAEVAAEAQKAANAAAG